MCKHRRRRGRGRRRGKRPAARVFVVVGSSTVVAAAQRRGLVVQSEGHGGVAVARNTTGRERQVALKKEGTERDRWPRRSTGRRRPTECGDQKHGWTTAGSVQNEANEANQEPWINRLPAEKPALTASATWR